MSKLMRLGQIILNRYEIIDLIAEGGQASIAKGIDRDTNNHVVIKQLSASPGQPHYDEELARFQRAARINIGHPNVIDPIDSGQEDGENYMIMVFIDGIILENHIRANGGKLSANEATTIIKAIASGLGAIHQDGIVHRDLKPENIIIHPDGNPYIIDLGICRDINRQTITKGDGFLGTLLWMSPEQVVNSGNEDLRTDLYSLGALFYFMLTGNLPVQGNDTGSIVISICQHMPPSPHQIDSSIPSHVDQACMKLLEKQPEHRFQTADDFIAALDGTIPIAQANCFCISCGLRTQPGIQYCQNCGAALNVSQSQSTLCLACGTPAEAVSVCPGCNRVFSNSDHHICFASGSLTGKSFRIPEGTFAVGRNELSPRDYHISRRHLLVVCSNGSVHIEDAGSANKTYVGTNLADHPILLTANEPLCIAGNMANYNHK